ncbi:MAG: AmmeMemoRadiSam system radical SAM enzyme [Desulfitobacteriaceae bacterium]|nr:AmmeMemoRadiSam system radical SAM enzyme [Desulfitobacteriaceae bacterium]MDD4346745.1 AmmeMemoRadiSam system radical SAM enzyme [Desulfitobacteriaceae bacterium]MDD4401972.1 AmmeMemoRadiSam system radical SAM enzyme [Desulfitobacteriaceae bacterium]
MKEAILYLKLDDNKVNCAVCNQRCIIAEGKKGICGVRENHQGSLYTLNYGKTIAANIDPIEKKPLYHFLPKTKIYSFAAEGCNFRCPWCQNWEISQRSKPNKPVEGIEISPEEHVKRTLAYSCLSIAYTYSEPTIYVEYALDTMKLAREEGLKNVWVSNGYMSRETLDTIVPYLDAANIDFKGPNDGIYEEYCGGKAEPIMENLKYLCKAEVHVEITTLVIPGINDKPEQLDKIAQFIAWELGPEVPWHVSRFFPAWKMNNTPVTPVEILTTARSMGQKAGLKYIHLGNVQ